MTNESAFFIEPKIVFGEIQPLLENIFSLFQIHRKKTYALLNVMLGSGLAPISVFCSDWGQKFGLSFSQYHGNTLL